MSNYLARHAIYNKKNKLIGYELLYRNGNTNSYPASVDNDFATYDLVNSTILNSPLSNTTDGKVAFINFTENCILGKLYEKLNNDDVRNFIIIELLETIKYKKDLIAHLKKMKKMGFTLALDDFIYDPSYDKILKYIDVIKLDVKLKQKYCFKIIKQAAIKENPNVKFLAEKIESEEEYSYFKGLNFDYFQGFYFGKPELIKITDSK